MRVLYVTSEAVPFAKTGGLADVAGSLTPQLPEAGVESTLFMPFYSATRRMARDVVDTGIEISIEVGEKILDGRFLKSQIPGTEVPVYFLDSPELFDRKDLYVADGIPYPDNSLRFIFFSRAALELIIATEEKYDIVHVNDWQSALTPVYIKTLYADEPKLKDLKSVLTIHNLSYQGKFWHYDMELTGLGWELFHWKRLEFYNKVNFLKGGIIYADAITTVSKRYAREIQTPEFSCGLEGVLEERADDISGILNGVDYQNWNPKDDRLIAKNYTAENMTGKTFCKKDLQERLRLRVDPCAPLIGLVTRLVEQKGIDLVIEAFESIMKTGAQLVILGNGEPDFQIELKRLAAENKKQAAAIISYDDSLAHQIEAGSDFFLMPSRFEPCGLNQMYSMKYGTVPIVRHTGGLADTVRRSTTANIKAGTANGFVFKRPTAKAMMACIKRAIDMYEKHPDKFKAIQATGMAEDFSWKKSAQSYVKLYKSLKRNEVESLTEE